MSLLPNLLAKLRRKPKRVTPILTADQAETLRGAVRVIDAPPPPPKPKSRGRVIKQTRHSEFNPDSSRAGGRIVKVMPKQLQKIKAAQEMVEDDGDQPKLEDLEV